LKNDGEEFCLQPPGKGGGASSVRYRCILLSLGGLDPTALGRLGLNPSCPAFEVSWKSLGKLNNSLSQTKKLVKEIFPKKIYLLVISIFILQFLLFFIFPMEFVQ